MHLVLSFCLYVAAHRACAYLSPMPRHHLPALAAKAAAASAALRSARARQRASELAPVIASLRASGATSLRTLAAGLNRAGIAAPRASSWSHMTVKRALEQINNLERLSAY